MLDKEIVAFEEKERVTIMENTKYYVAGYLRLSKEDGDKEESDSIGSQRSIIETKIKELGEKFELFDLYIDDGYTGLNTDRPSFQRMLKDIENGVINAVITKDLSRLSRNSFEANYYIEIYFLERNIRYISILDNVDTYIKNSNNDICSAVAFNNFTSECSNPHFHISTEYGGTSASSISSV